MGTLVDEAHHLVNIVQQAQPERLKLEGDIHVLSVSVIAQDAAGGHCPSPLIRRRDNFALPQVLAQDQHDVSGSELGRQIDEPLASGYVEIANRVIEIDKAGGN